MHHLLRRKIIVLGSLFLLMEVKAQHAVELNLADHDVKPYYFGIMLGYNTSHYNITHDPSFTNPALNKKIADVESGNTGRIHLGIMANYQLSKRFDLRFYPLNLVFSEKKLDYLMKSNAIENQRAESIVMSFPLQVRLKSDRINNFRVYTLAGAKYDFDLASNAGARNSDNMLKIKKNDYGVEGGIGFQFFLPYFILSPEIKFSYGLSNIHARDADLIYSSVVDKMNSRMLMFSLHFEGGGMAR
ncbi:MAG: PorT family protein [Chitinophagia bacterium]|nr:PorT family protein [Chitinophagia bacterium]